MTKDPCNKKLIYKWYHKRQSHKITTGTEIPYRKSRPTRKQITRVSTTLPGGNEVLGKLRRRWSNIRKL